MYEKCTQSIIFIETESNMFICMVIDSLVYLIALTSCDLFNSCDLSI